MKVKGVKNILKGFTLIEVLIVITIIVLIGAISVPVATRMINRGKATAAAKAMKDVNAAMNAYHEDYAYLPTADITITTTADSGSTSKDNPTDAADADATTAGFRQLIGALTGEETGNERRIKYLELDDCVDADNASCRNGITRAVDPDPNDDIQPAAHGILDPWGKGYFIQYDLDRDGSVVIGSTAGAYSGNTVNLGGFKVLMISAGADGSFDDDDTDIKSWE